MRKLFFLLTFFWATLIVYSQDNVSNIVKLKSSEVKNFQFSEYLTKVIITDNNNSTREKANNASVQNQKTSNNFKGQKNSKTFYNPNLTRVTTKK